MNAIDFLIKEHNRVRKMLRTISNDSQHNEMQKKQFQILSQDLLRHEMMEHDVWYPYFKDQLPDTVKHLLTEEQHAEKAIKKMSIINSPDAWQEQFLKFKRAVEQHAAEEENELFPEVSKILSPKELDLIGIELSDFNTHHATKFH